MSDFFNFSGGKKNRTPRSSTLNTGAFQVNTQVNSGDEGGATTTLKRLGTPAQMAFDTRSARQLSDFDSLRERLNPGFGALTKARLAGVNNARSRGIGNLKDRLAQRRVSGSSFGNADLIAAEREFGEAEAQARAQGELEERAAQLDLAQRERQVILDGINREFKEAGFSADFGANYQRLVAQADGIEQKIAAAKSQAGFDFLGEVTGAAIGTGSRAMGGAGGKP